MEHGEYATRGALLDLFPMGSEQPYRLDFFDDEIDSLRLFDVDSQRTLEEVAAINLLPAHEFPTDQAAIELFRSQWRDRLRSSATPNISISRSAKGRYRRDRILAAAVFQRAAAAAVQLLPGKRPDRQHRRSGSQRRAFSERNPRPFRKPRRRPDASAAAAGTALAAQR
jgi:transcription-repair coupling factor (superfamily II helicase)